MPIINCTLSSFKRRPPIEGTRAATFSYLDLTGAAAKVGIPLMFSHSESRRPLLEMVWRVAMVHSNLAISTAGNHWTRSAAYNRLDPSEKGAVSYFLGMTQAALTTRNLLGYSHLVHVDVLLQHQGTPLTSTRPDFVAVGATSPTAGQHFSATVEAKGRTNGFDFGALRTAKHQAQTIPSVAGLAVRECIASVSYFNNAGQWESFLQDPQSDTEELSFGLETFLFLYYRNIIDAGRDSQTWIEDAVECSFNLPGYPLTLKLPTPLVRAYDESSEIPNDNARDEIALITCAYLELASGTEGLNSDLVEITSRDDNSENELEALFRDIDTDPFE